ncbi:cell cycle exit and neuronal differentiation protein 1 [Spea bombifrons]|uniref:cell cycle exit and neuronal differentiation protein 1 n=1 Tax=Spea bombifrons TaxID=233779 RepID=UPI002349C4D4|nr:cell cycle exit and neuronal differentiation protein 1 [Spea bombifrons]XP_053304609.1 cell cycle exit and neuronal differentiation protein 1 [Spea bombifrons]
MEAKPRSSSIKASKTDKANPAAGTEKKEGPVKEQPNPTPKKPVAGEAAPVNHDGAKPTATESQGPPNTSENKGSDEEQDTSNGAAEGSGFEGLKPLLVAAGVAVAAIAVIVGAVFLARKK